MPRGDKSSYSAKQKRQARHIEEGYEAKGVSSKTAAKRAWATVNKQDGGAKGGGKRKSRSSSTRTSSRRGTSRSRSRSK